MEAAIGGMETEIRETPEGLPATQGVQTLPGSGGVQEEPGLKGTRESRGTMGNNRPPDRVRANTSEEINRQIDRERDIHIRAYAQMGPEEISRRISELDRETDVERTLEMNASILAFTGVILALFGGRKWLIIPGAVMAFLFQHATQGWCPPVPLLRRMGVRTRKEIDQEKYALKAMRGDFATNESLPLAESALQSVKS